MKTDKTESKAGAETGAEAGIRTIVDYLTSVPAWYLATCEGDQPHVRPFSFAAEQDGRIWFATATTKDVYRELEANPKFELTAWKPGHGWIILRGKADLHDAATLVSQDDEDKEYREGDGGDDSRLEIPPPRGEGALAHAM